MSRKSMKGDTVACARNGAALANPFQSVLNRSAATNATAPGPGAAFAGKGVFGTHDRTVVLEIM